jgi:hypothetical protein
MNVQRLIEKYKKLEGVWDAEGAESARKIFLADLKQLDEPKPVKVPQFVAEKIEYFKKSGDWDLFRAMDYMFGEKEIKEWFEDKDNQETFALAWILGYEVEEEKRYLVKVKGVVWAYLNYDNINELWNFNRKQDGLAVHSYHTRKELEEAGFGWVFSCEGIEIEEVE